MDKPLLINKRKFDIRCFVLVTAINGNLWAYWYKDGYIRTSCKEFTLKNVTNKFIHLTNDAIQKKSENYGKFEPGNKLSYNEFQKHFDQNASDLGIDMENNIIPQMKKIAWDSIKATYRQLDKSGRHHTFEVFGYDFMVDDSQLVKLIEVNTNPCLELSSNYLSRIIPAMIDDWIKIAVDPIFPAPESKNMRKSQVPDYGDSGFELMFNKLKDSASIININQSEVIIEEDEDDDREDGDGDDNDDPDDEESDLE